MNLAAPRPDLSALDESLIDAGGLGRFTCDEAGRLLWASTKLAELLGDGKVERLLARAPNLCGDLLQISAAEIERDTRRLLCRATRSDGTLMWGEVTLCHREEKDHRTIIEGLFQDQGELLRLRKEQEQLWQLSDEIRCTADRSGRLTRVNGTFAEVLGYRPEEVVGKFVHDLAMPSDRDHVEESVRLATCGDPVLDQLSEWRNRDGRPILIKWTALGDGEATHLIGRRSARNDQVVRQSNIGTALFDNPDHAIFVTDLSGIILSVNSSFTRITGFSSAEAVGKTPKILRSGRHDEQFYARFYEALQLEGSWTGRMWNRHRDGSIHAVRMTVQTVTDDSGIPTHYVSFLTDTTENVKNEERIHYHSFYDALTGLANRQLFETRGRLAVESAIADGGPLWMLLVDLDNLTLINKTLGSAAGDLVLQETSRRLRAELRRSDILARIGGDKFAVILVASDSRAKLDPEVTADRLMQILRQPYQIGGDELFCTASIAIAELNDRSMTLADLQRACDAALAQVKEVGGDSIARYSETIGDRLGSRIRLEAGLRRAVELGEFILFYQPQFDLKNESIVGAEALIRWKSPEKGLVSPGQFIDVAEETGLIVSMGSWAIHQALQDLKTWHLEGIDVPRISVNVSWRQFGSRDFYESVTAVLEEVGVEASRLELELTESLVMQDPSLAIGIVSQLRDLGVTIAIDDFGTGYSSLSHLKHLPIQRLKIDRSFIKDLPENGDDLAITDAILALAKSLSLETVAEGVETNAQRQHLADRGCDMIQGFLLGRPMPSSDFVDFARDHLKHLASH